MVEWSLVCLTFEPVFPRPLYLDPFCYWAANLSTCPIDSPQKAMRSNQVETGYSIPSSDWDVILPSLGCVGLWNVFVFLPVSILGYVPFLVSIFILIEIGPYLFHI